MSQENEELNLLSRKKEQKYGQYGEYDHGRRMDQLYAGGDQAAEANCQSRDWLQKDIQATQDFKRWILLS